MWDKEELKRENIVGVERLCNKNCSELTNVPIQVWKWKTYHPFWSTMILMTRFLKIGLSFWTLVATQKDSPGRKIIQYKLQRADSHSQPIKVSYFLSNINKRTLFFGVSWKGLYNGTSWLKENRNGESKESNTLWCAWENPICFS